MFHGENINVDVSKQISLGFMLEQCWRDHGIQNLSRISLVAQGEAAFSSNRV
jgi:hypothetical protein